MFSNFYTASQIKVNSVKIEFVLQSLKEISIANFYRASHLELKSTAYIAFPELGTALLLVVSFLLSRKYLFSFTILCLLLTLLKYCLFVRLVPSINSVLVWWFLTKWNKDRAIRKISLFSIVAPKGAKKLKNEKLS